MALTRKMAKMTRTAKGINEKPCTKPLLKSCSFSMVMPARSLMVLVADKYQKMMAVMTQAGTVVYIIFLMWSNKSTPTSEAAILVVSDKGDILSPNNAPEMTAPATMAGFAPKRLPYPKMQRPRLHKW